jgi:hypothetical protein
MATVRRTLCFTHFFHWQTEANLAKRKNKEILMDKAPKRENFHERELAAQNCASDTELLSI